MRSQILDLLFKPKFGAGFQHLKVEMGGGGNSTCGSEPSHAITKEELKNPKSRGYEFWFMREAKDHNADMILEYLPWSFPGWLKPNIFTQDGADYFVAFLDVAKRDWGLDIDWVAAAENENGTDLDWIVKHLRPALDAKGCQNVRIQGPDDNSGDWQIFEELKNDPEYRKEIKAVGYHYVTGREFTEDSQVTPCVRCCSLGSSSTMVLFRQRLCAVFSGEGRLGNCSICREPVHQCLPMAD